jgi:hypothetical protein
MTIYSSGFALSLGWLGVTGALGCIWTSDRRYRTNWFVLYRNIKKNWNDLKGLRNRKRIWEFQTQLLELINMK